MEGVVLVEMLSLGIAWAGAAGETSRQILQKKKKLLKAMLRRVWNSSKETRELFEKEYLEDMGATLKMWVRWQVAIKHEMPGFLVRQKNS